MQLLDLPDSTDTDADPDTVAQQEQVPSPKSVITSNNSSSIRNPTRKRLRFMSSQEHDVQWLLPADIGIGIGGVPGTSSSPSLPSIPMPLLPQKRAAPLPPFMHHDIDANHPPGSGSGSTGRDPPKQKKRRNWAPIAIVPMKNIAIPTHLPAAEALDLKLHYRAMLQMEQQIFGVSTLLSLVKYALKGSADLKKIAALGRRLSKTRKRFLNVQRGVFDVQNERNACTVIPQQQKNNTQTQKNTNTKQNNNINSSNSRPRTRVDDIQDVSPGFEPQEPQHPSSTTVPQPVQFSSSNRPQHSTHSDTPLQLTSSEKNDGQDDEHHHSQVIGSEAYGPSTEINTNINNDALSNMHHWNSPDCTTSFSPMGMGNTNSASRNHFQAPSSLIPPQHQNQNLFPHHHQQHTIPNLDLNNFSAIDTREIAASYNNSNINVPNHHPATPQRNASSSLDHPWLPGVNSFDGDNNTTMHNHNVPNVTTLPNMATVSNHHLASHFPHEEASVSKLVSSNASGYPSASNHFSVPIQHSSVADMNTYSHGKSNIVDKIDTTELASQSQFTIPDFSPVTPIAPHRNNNINSLANWEASYTSSMTNAMGASQSTPTAQTDMGHAHNAVFEPSHNANPNANLRMPSQQASMLGQYGQLRDLMGLGGETRNNNNTSDLGSFVNQHSEGAYFSAHN